LNHLIEMRFFLLGGFIFRSASEIEEVEGEYALVWELPGKIPRKFDFVEHFVAEARFITGKRSITRLISSNCIAELLVYHQKQLGKFTLRLLS
jgi:hypothetical protein